jgi:hypothetical protein
MSTEGLARDPLIRAGPVRLFHIRQLPRKPTRASVAGPGDPLYTQNQNKGTTCWKLTAYKAVGLEPGDGY